jgi:predicted nucleic acid-binding protein
VARARKRPLRIYADTSLFGGCFDREFEVHSKRFFELVRIGRIFLLISDLVERELLEAPARVRSHRASLDRLNVLPVEITAEVHLLRDAYISAGVVGERSLDDALHVAAATASRADAIVSWNFRDIDGLRRVRGYNHVNHGLGYGELTIVTPRSVLANDEA